MIDRINSLLRILQVTRVRVHPVPWRNPPVSSNPTLAFLLPTPLGPFSCKSMHTSMVSLRTTHPDSLHAFLQLHTCPTLLCFCNRARLRSSHQHPFLQPHLHSFTLQPFLQSHICTLVAMNLIDNLFELNILSNVNLDPGLAVQACNPTYAQGRCWRTKLKTNLGILVRPCLK